MSVVLMIIAAFGLLPALAGAWLQEVVDLSTILWALRTAAPPPHARRRPTSLIAIDEPNEGTFSPARAARSSSHSQEEEPT
jgi:hypothetical protein